MRSEWKYVRLTFSCQAADELSSSIAVLVLNDCEWSALLPCYDAKHSWTNTTHTPQMNSPSLLQASTFSIFTLASLSFVLFWNFSIQFSIIFIVVVLNLLSNSTEDTSGLFPSFQSWLSVCVSVCVCVCVC